MVTSTSVRASELTKVGYQHNGLGVRDSLDICAEQSYGDIKLWIFLESPEEAADLLRRLVDSFARLYPEQYAQYIVSEYDRLCNAPIRDEADMPMTTELAKD